MAKTPEERAAEWFGEQRKKPRPGSLNPIAEKEHGIPEGVVLTDILHISPEELKAHPLNERYFRTETEEYFRRLSEDIQERGILVSLIAKMDGTILAGHNRWKVAREIGLNRIPVQKVTGFLSEEKEKEFLIKDNYLRRHLTAAEKERLIRELYGKEIHTGSHGGDRGNQYTGGKVQMNLAKKIEEETGIKAGTAQRIVAKIRKKERRADIPADTSQISAKEQRRGERLVLKLKTLRDTRGVLEKKLEEVKRQEKSVMREIKSIGQPELFGVETDKK